MQWRNCCELSERHQIFSLVAKQRLIFGQISFAYPSNPQKKVLDNASFFFPAGETSYIVGSSGSGKSTLGNILLKFYEARSGQITIDGHDIRSLDSTWLRRRITLVQQQSVLFNETIHRNIALGKHTRSTDYEISEAVTMADLEQTLASMANGINTMIDANGKCLSGGQQQRIILARARLCDAPILILDEATSALDQQSRAKVNNMIRKWRKGKTTIIITHDVTQILNMEYVYVMKDGVVVEEGYRGKLLEDKSGVFAAFMPAEETIYPQPPQIPVVLSSILPLPPSKQRQSRWSTYLGQTSQSSTGTFINFSKPRPLIIRGSVAMTRNPKKCD